MKRAKLIATACFTAMLAVFTSNVAAQDFNTNERTFLTFSNTVELPGVTLQPGTYLFRLADSQSNRHIVQVFTQDEKQILATLLAVPSERLEVTGENVVTFRESAEGTTPAVQYWYYPGDRIGHEFVYPKEQAQRIAQRTGQNVLTSDGVASSDSRVSSVSPSGEVSEWTPEQRQAAEAEAAQGQVQGTTGVSQMPEQTTAQAEQAKPEPSESVNPASETPDPAAPETQPAEPAPQASAAASSQTAMTDQRGHSGVSAETMAQQNPAADERGHSGVMDQQAVGTSGRTSELPATASPLPLAGLVGLFSLGGALTIRRMRK
jgi:hypothetical protein